MEVYSRYAATVYEEKCCGSSRAAPTFSDNAPLFLMVFESVPVNVESVVRIPRGECDKRMREHISHTGVCGGC